MNIFIGACVIMAAIGSVIESVAGGDVESCPLPYDEDDGFSREKLINDNVLYCSLATNGTDIRRDVVNSGSPQELRTLLRDYCAMAPVAARCIANVTTIAQLCLTRPQLNVFKVSRDLLQQVYDVGCEQDGARVAAIFVEARESFNVTQREALAECSRVAENMIVNRSTRDATLISLQRYRVVKAFRECVVEFGGGQSSVVDKLEVLFDEVLERATCFDQTTTSVPCSSIDNS